VLACLALANGRFTSFKLLRNEAVALTLTLITANLATVRVILDAGGEPEDSDTLDLAALLLAGLYINLPQGFRPSFLHLRIQPPRGAATEDQDQGDTKHPAYRRGQAPCDSLYWRIRVHNYSLRAAQRA